MEHKWYDLPDAVKRRIRRNAKKFGIEAVDFKHYAFSAKSKHCMVYFYGFGGNIPVPSKTLHYVISPKTQRLTDTNAVNAFVGDVQNCFCFCEWLKLVHEEYMQSDNNSAAKEKEKFTYE